MRLRSLHRRLIGWTAMLALLLSCVVPTLLQSLSDAPVNAGFCVAASESKGQMPDGGSGGPGGGPAGAHCPLCVLHHLGTALPPTPLIASTIAVARPAPSPSPIEVPPGISIRSPAQPRAPPSISLA